LNSHVKAPGGCGGTIPSPPPDPGGAYAIARRYLER
jgi:hypothetical protein